MEGTNWTTSTQSSEGWIKIHLQNYSLIDNNEFNCKYSQDTTDSYLKDKGRIFIQLDMGAISFKGW